MTLSGINELPLPGKLRMLSKRTLPEYIQLPFYSHDRSITEWNDLFKSYRVWKEVPQRTIEAEERYNPFFHWKATGVLLENEYAHQMKLRWVARKWIQRVRARLYRRRLIGDTDLRTLDPIANKDAVEVFCHNTKTIYRFHVHSMIRMIRENLYFEQWGRADPMNPRNPYTNQAWSLPQLMNLIHQIQGLAFERGETLPSFLARFVEARYSINTFFMQNQLELGMDATRRFFQTSESRIVRSELLHQLFEQINKLHKTSLYRSVQQRKCPPIYQNSWELLLQNKWMHDNYGYSPRYMWRDSMEQTITIQQIYQKTLQWHISGILIPQEPPPSEESDGPDSS